MVVEDVPAAPARGIEALYDLSRAVAAADDLPAIYEAALECLEHSLDVRRASILLFDDQGVMRFVAWRGLSEKYRRAVDGHSPWTPETANPQPVLVEDVREAPSLATLRPAIEAEGIRALAFVPLGAPGRLLGKFMLYHEEPHEYDTREVRIAETIGAHVGFAIEQHRARMEQELAAEILEGQRHALELLVSGTPLEDVLAGLASIVNEASGGTAAASILLVDEAGRMHNGASPGLPKWYLDEIDGLEISPTAGTCLAAAARRVPVITVDIASDPAWEGLAHLPLKLGFPAAWSQPILARDGRALGTFGTYFRTKRAPTHRERQVVEVLARTASIAIEGARADDALRSQRDHLEGMFRSSVAGIMEIDGSGRILAVNDRYCSIAGRSRDQLIDGMTCFDFTHPEDEAESRAAVASLSQGAQNYVLEKRYVRPDGTVAWVSKSASALRDPSGRLLGAVAVVTDITQRKLADEALRESEQRYRELVTALGLAVYTTDADGVITLYNEAASELWGRSPELGKDRWCGSWKLFWPDGRPMPLEDCPMGIAIRERRVVRGQEIIAERPDGTRATVLPYPTPMLDSDGRLVGAVNVLVDITEQRRTQEALKDAVRAKDDFLGQVSHELRTPITQITGNADLLLRRWQGLDPAIQVSSLEEIHAQAARLQRLVENMLVLSRFERGVTPTLEPHLIQHLMQETISEFRRRFPDAVVDVAIPGNLPPVETNPSTVDQVVWNLLTNAQKYGPPEGPIRLRAHLAGPFVEILILDEGNGVPDEDLPRLFEPYFRSSSAPEHAAGLGLGLSVCKRLVEAQGGTMWVQRRPSGGMEFGVRFPALDDTDA